MKLRVLLLFVFCTQVHALTIQWFGTTCVALSAQGKTVLFDPFFDRPNLLETLSPFSYDPDPKVTKKWLASLPPGHEVVAILSSHSHYDHILDGPNVMKLTKAHFYGSPTALEIIKEKDIENSRLHSIKHRESIEVEGFKITPYPGVHPPHFLSFTLASGKLEHPLNKPASIFSYKMGEVYNFVIEHAEGRVLFHPSAYFSEQTPVEKTDLLILGVANRRSSKELIEKVIRPSAPNFLISTHHDDLFEELSLKKPSVLFPDDFNEWSTQLKNMAPRVKHIQLKYGEKLSLPTKSLTIKVK